MVKALNLVGQRFGRLTVLRNATKEEKPKDENGKPLPRTWCVCICDCDPTKELIIQATRLNKNKVLSCGCLQKEKVGQLNVVDLSNKKFNRLLVLEKAYSKNGSIYWKCQCDCGKITYVSTHSLQSGNTKSCGCLKGQKIKNLIGQRFGKLVVVEEDGKHSDNFYYWKCKCDCGNEIIVRGNNLKTGTTQSCGCIKSRGEEFVNQYLQQKNFNYQREYSFPDLISTDRGGLLRFDFCILDAKNIPKYLIEVNGTQHFKSYSGWYSETMVQHDEQKKNYCSLNHIPFLILNYSIDDTIPKKEWLNQLNTFLNKEGCD